jgi:hypothetical protein
MRQRRRHELAWSRNGKYNENRDDTAKSTPPAAQNIPFDQVVRLELTGSGNNETGIA